MKKNFTLLLASACMLTAAADESNIVTLDLTKAVTELTFDADNGAWTGTYVEAEEVIESQSFIFIKNANSTYQSWDGFTASNKVDNSRPENTMTYQFSNMACGGIVLNEDGTVKTDEFGAPVTSGDVPYLVCFENAYSGSRSIDMIFNDGNNYEPVGVYLNLNSYTFYSVMLGDSYSRAFTENDRYTIKINGVGPNEEIKTVTVDLASFKDGILSIARGWKWVDLSELGEVSEIYFNIESTDNGAWGMNTPGYFCMDKLMVKKASAGVNNVSQNDVKINYDRASHTVSIPTRNFAIIYDINGNKVMSGEEASYDISSLSRGVYIVKSGNNSLKIVR